MNTKEEVFEKVSSILVELFDVNPADIRADANLYKELDIDSIDAVDLVVELKKVTGKKLEPENFKTVQTVQDVVDAIFDLIQG